MCLTLPHHFHTPARAPKRRQRPRIPSPVPVYLHPPIPGIGHRRAPAPGAVVPVPETAMHQHDAPTGRHHNVRFARQVGAMERESATQSV